MSGWVAVIMAGVAVAGAVTTIVGLVLSRRSEVESNATQDEINEFNILRGTVQTLNEECDRLKRSLAECNDTASAVNYELDIAQRNVRVLSAFIDRHVERDIARPRLERMTRVE